MLGADDGVVGYETVGTRIALDDLNLPVAVPTRTWPPTALPDDVEIVALTPVSNLAMGEYPASIAALDDQGDLEFVADRIYGGGEQALAKVRHGNAVIADVPPVRRGGGQVLTVGQHRLGVRPRTRCGRATSHEQRRPQVVRDDASTH